MRKDIILAIAGTAAAASAAFFIKKRYDQYKVFKSFDVEDLYECKILHTVLVFNAEETMQVACFDKYEKTGEITITTYTTSPPEDIFGYQEEIECDMHNMLVIRRKDGTYKWMSMQY